MTKNLSKNIWKLSLIKFLSWFMVIMPVIVLYYQENGLDLQQVFFLQAYFGAWIVAFEVPSGYFADRYGRRNSMILGSIMLASGYLLYSLSQGFWWFLAAETFLGLGISFISGADSALLYDTLLEEGKKDKYRATESKLHSLSSLSEGTASLLAGLIAMISLRSTAIAQFIAVACTIPLSIMLVEPKKQEAHSTETSWKDIKKIVHFSLHENKELKWMILYAALLGASTFTVVWFVQPMFKAIDLPLGFYGAAWAILQFSIAFFALFADKYENKLGLKTALVSLLFFPVIAYATLGLTLSAFSIVALFLFYFVRAIKEPIIKDFINKICPSTMRATVLSVRSMLMRLTFICIGPLVGWISDTYSLQTALLSCAIIFFCTSSVAIAGLKYHRVI